MKLLIAFFKDKTREISLYAGTVGIFIVVAFLYNIRMDALKYALLLVILWLLLYVITEYHRFRKKHLLLERFKKSTQECTKELPECRNLLELDYQELLGIFDEKILELKSEARIKGQDLSDYYGMWVHQIKTPMAVMKLYLGTESPEHRAMGTELFRMEQYVDMVLQYLRLSSGENDLVIREYKLDELIREAVRKYAAQFVLKKLRLTYISTEISVVTDRKWFGCILEQLLSNAIKYTPAGGSIAICVEEDALHISDTGIGIAPEDLPRIFEKGYTGENGRLERTSSGLGLYLAGKAADMLHIPIHVESTVGRGTAFTLHLRQE